MQLFLNVGLGLKLWQNWPQLFLVVYVGSLQKNQKREYLEPTRQKFGSWNYLDGLRKFNRARWRLRGWRRAWKVAWCIWWYWWGLRRAHGDGHWCCIRVRRYFVAYCNSQIVASILDEIINIDRVLGKKTCHFLVRILKIIYFIKFLFPSWMRTGDLAYQIIRQFGRLQWRDNAVQIIVMICRRHNLRQVVADRFCLIVYRATQVL
jgi:uncharacterized protein YlbG (UPF0298 family)